MHTTPSEAGAGRDGSSGCSSSSELGAPGAAVGAGELARLQASKGGSSELGASGAAAGELERLQARQLAAAGVASAALSSVLSSPTLAQQDKLQLAKQLT